ncbi:MAG TPA: COR domain-containing protein [Saprospiraceae bacterium]|nr:COR domain-containing protein [Saprospiraceae bacterium]
MLEKLSNLHTLDLIGNQITDLSFVERLTNLQTLSLGDIPNSNWGFFDKLPHLQSLNLARNQITDARFLEKILHLQSLDIRNNQISDCRFLEKLINLRKVDLTNNQIYDLSSIFPFINERGLQVVWKEWHNTHVGEINLKGNPITNPPIETVRQGNAAILEYFRQKEATGAELLLEAKLILLGDGRAGKTSLANRLLGKALPTEADRTQGVDIIIGEYAFPVAGGGTFQLNIWDFAGQDKYKPLHQFFYTESSLYVMVAESGNSGTDYDDWFQTAELFGEGSPLLLAINEFRDGTGLGSFDVERWKKRFPNLLKEVFSVNLGTQRGMEELRHHIHLLAQALPHTRYEFPKNWAAVRRELESRRSEHFISLQEYLRICRENQLPERDSALILSSVLHKIGVCLHYQKSELLRQFVILNNEWATGAVYKILEDRVVAETKRGFFDWDDLRRIWHEDSYCDMQPQLLELMQQFKMAYPLPNGREYVAPPLLSPAPPESWEWPAGESLAMYVEYEFMPKLLMTQFIVSRYMDIAEGRTQVWRNGVALRWPAALAEVVKSKSQGRDAFLIRVQGKGGKGLLTAIRNTLRDLHDEYRGIRPHEIIPCPCSGCRSGKNRQHYFDYENLQNRLEKGRRVVECDKSLEELNLLELLGALFVFDSLEVGRPPRMREVASPAALERQGLEEQLNLTIQKLNRIREALAIENDPSAKFKYEKQIETLELEIAEVRQKLRGMNG